ncbi:hypothetical protein SARC_14752 [Sphaeroforma arctica JP610]|uniref:Uncharacterized protein n=1 Tax=Sphaeroforma arctica JP610 TaxID=667725 RepID=A0A0L0F9A3_9EUKA|nr:hypothetical protein SARC_14752 [Sphaeroforma arctica JP610]KNC72688.1 hypothetical protein SARC_14752 [Sphaeroforma arctica JP610]|eukprot:XP_014146590.1 hypothetical protein SARC_14752 [Sphaeroforma arctica JP610]
MSQQQIQAVMGQLALHFQTNYPQQWASMNPQQQQVYVYNMALQQLGQSAPAQAQSQLQHTQQRCQIVEESSQRYSQRQVNVTSNSSFNSGLNTSRQASISSQGYSTNEADLSLNPNQQMGALAPNELKNPALMTEKEKLELVKSRLAEQQSQRARLLQETKERMRQNSQLKPKVHDP